MAMSVHLVIPCFRESGRLPGFLPGLCAAMDALGGVRVLVVDDGSGTPEWEATCALVETLRPAHPCLDPLLALPDNLGKGGAVYAGWRASSKSADWLAFVDADGSCSASETSRLLRLAQSQPGSLAAIDPNLSGEPPAALIASRVKMLGRKVDRQLKRHLIGRVYATLVSQLLGIPVYDSQCGLKVIPHAAFTAVAPGLKVRGFAFDVDLILALLNHGSPVLEVPIDWHEVPGGKVRLLRDSWRMAREIWRLRRFPVKPPPPLAPA